MAESTYDRALQAAKIIESRISNSGARSPLAWYAKLPMDYGSPEPVHEVMSISGRQAIEEECGVTLTMKGASSRAVFPEDVERPEPLCLLVESDEEWKVWSACLGLMAQICNALRENGRREVPMVFEGPFAR